MKNVLWSQGISETDPGYFVIDGQESRYSTSNVEQEEALIIMNTGKFELIYKKEKDSSLKLKQNKEWLYIEGSFNEKDTIGRIRVYRFLTNQKIPSEIIQTLKNYAKKINCTINKNNERQIQRILKRKLFFSLKNMFIGLIIVMLLAIIGFLV